MNMDDLAARGLVLLGCGKMGSAMLEGWLEGGLPPASVWVIDPGASNWLAARAAEGLHLNEELPEAPAAVLLAVKPQMMDQALPQVAGYADGRTVFLSVAAGKTLAYFAERLGVDAPVIRAMPNTPAAVGRGITALIGNAHVDDAALALAEQLLSAVGQTVRLQHEGQMDAVTAVSGSGPAYVFHLIETLAAAGQAQGLPPEMAMKLAKATVGGAGQLAEQADEDPAQLRVNVTSPGGTTAAALAVLMDAETGFPTLLDRAVTAAAERSRELGK
ncbi:pyrroline-5-carboxylate reductase [Rhodovulum adriaticum]|uniref:Pyrroline-5-carboxylate reductase n=1 Tax=Rhodovulum adriaticum TaxID=35804 RepID=A0A4R2NXG6_RHOAD|nr:pyrroline-5-carboxylate reductase [Rhodovulum adriaticum]MBK1635209.1 pyrroline-5-carboxylate reductase [Rhodovulum adriaticum]TCP26344.1 pyrroline-5-carboxylate reductase [Rhodovulum adriaticum]